MVSLDDDPYVTTISHLELSPPEEKTRYWSAKSFDETYENIEPSGIGQCGHQSLKEAQHVLQKAGGVSGYNTAFASVPSESSVTKVSRPEIDRLIGKS